MRVALLNPPWPHAVDPMLWGVRAGSRWPHFQRRAAPGALPRYIPFPFFLAIAARLLLLAGHEVLLVDGVAANTGWDEFYRRLKSFRPQAVFVETSTPSLRHDLEIMRELRRILPDARLAAGGTHPGELAARLFADPGAPDGWLVGEYEQSLTALIAAWAAGGDTSVIPGFLTAGGRSPVAAVTPDVDFLPAPLFDQLPMDAYSDPVCGLPAPVAQTWLSRGCPYACTFCVWPQVVYGNRHYRPRNIGTALDEVELLLRDYGCESFYFDDDTANIGESRMIDLAADIRRRGLDRYPWSMMARADCMTPRMLDALAGAGLYSVKYGVESCAPRLLNACNKATDWPRLRNALRRTRDLGVKIHLTFTLGLPGETPETIRQTIRFALETAPETAQFSICTPFPGTAFYEHCRRNRWLTSEDWECYLGSGAAVVGTPWLAAGNLEDGYQEALTDWRAFTAARLSRRQEALTSRLRAITAGGGRWLLLGEPEFADFLLRDSALKAACAAANPGNWNHMHAAVVPVIVSRHDEEKILRRLRRANPGLAARAERLFADGPDG